LLLAVPLALIVVLFGLEFAQAHVLIFKDGFTLVGTIKRETTTTFDADAGQVFSQPKLGGFFFLDDDARRIYYSPKQVLEPEDKDPNRGADLVVLKSAMYRATNFKLPGGLYAGFTPWDDKWNRIMTLESGPNSKLNVEQHLTTLTPHFARVDARRYNWSPFYLTQELDPEAVRQTLLKHPDLRLKGTNEDVPKRFRIYSFMRQAGWYDKARTELDGILKDFPDQKDKVQASRENLNKLLTIQLLDLIEQAKKCGRHQWAQARLAAFPQQLADEAMLVRVRALQAGYETANKNVALARQYLAELPALVLDGSQRSLLGEAAAAIAPDLNPDTIDRLETFISLGQQAQRDREQNRTPAYSPEQLLALAASGWLMGNAAAEPKIENSLHLWRARQFIHEHLRTHDPVARQRLAVFYQKNGELAYDELARLIRSLPPPEAFVPTGPDLTALALTALPLSEANLAWAVAAGQMALPGKRYEFQATLPWTPRKGPNYFLQLPPEYHPGRLYPVLFVLHEAGQKPEDMLQRWSRLAGQHGYLLLAPAWQRRPGELYSYSADEHRAVLDVLRDLRQRFQVDSDRVFLAGFGQGANMAFDVGLSHPDQFAGVAPMGGRPHLFASRYWPNGQYLPFYVMDGELGDGAKDNRRLFENWIPHGYPAIFVQYRGRGSEWFEAELPVIFDWMSRKKRAAAFPDLGRSGGGPFGDEFQSMRPTDNRFYWLSGDGLSEKRINDTARNFSYKVSPATLQGRISEGNQINVHANGFRTITVWLGQGMIDFEKPLKIYVNLQLRWANRKVTPSSALLLEDLYLRGDRQRQFLAKVELTL
jgi:hypothetical protein